ncbi:MAG: 8-oxo-dGTP diphosphatase [Candidatus Diapherotrites archaeon]|nr:8-oxo-dGTP diphosphatase [Candidatus Diapherotrites archaeon]
MKLATLCYVRKDNKTLMIHRVKKQNDLHEGKYNGLGGKLEAGESPEDCVKREVLEESGLKIKNPHLWGLLTFANFKGEDWYVFVFIAKEFSGELIDSNEGNLHWIDNDKILLLPLNEDDQYFVPLLEEKGFFSAKFIYEGNKILSYEIFKYK